MSYEGPFTPDKVVAYVESLNHATWKKSHYLQYVRGSVVVVDLRKLKKLSEQEVKKEEARCVAKTIKFFMNHKFLLPSDRTIFIKEEEIDFLCRRLFDKYFNPLKTSKTL